MLFSSGIFLIFWPVSLLIWWLSSHKISVIIIGSIIFYSYWNPYYTVLPITLSLLAFYIVKMLFSSHQRKKKSILIFGIILILLPLVYFKYLNFVTGSNLVTAGLPLGISFITFTLISYIVDIYRGTYAKFESLKILNAYILFFPQLIAGPILRPSELIPQIRRSVIRRNLRFTLGMLIFSVGIIKKIIFADSFGLLVDPVYSNPEIASFNNFLLAFYGFAFQIYFDFSGYTDMAIGIALSFGIKLPENFRAPYLSGNIREFWRNWHKTLSNWFRDYVYIPLGGNRSGPKRKAINTVITMVLCGLWHGAGLNFLIWGFAHGILVALSRDNTKKDSSILISSLKILFTFHTVCILWVFFRAEDFDQSITFYLYFYNAFNITELFSVYSCLILLVPILLIFQRWDNFQYWEFIESKINKQIIYASFIIICLLLVALSNGSSGQFIYFDF